MRSRILVTIFPIGSHIIVYFFFDAVVDYIAVSTKVLHIAMNLRLLESPFDDIDLITGVKIYLT